MSNINVFDWSLLKIDKRSHKNIDIYYIGYISLNKIDDYNNIYSVNPLYLIVNTENGHIEEKSRSKYFVFDSTDKNQKTFK